MVSCAASVFAFLAVFLRFASNRGKHFDSLCANAYGIYLLHYPIVSWLQYVMLKSPMAGFLKGVIVTAGSLALSWGATAILRRLPGVGRII